MGYFDRRNSLKMRRRKAQKKKGKAARVVRTPSAPLKRRGKEPK